MIYTKNENNELVSTETKEEIRVFNIEFLIKQKEKLEGELLKINTLLEEARKLEI